MKITILLILLSFNINHSFAQFEDYGFLNNEKIIKSNKVKTLAIYSFENKSNRKLTQFNIYDSLGGRLSLNMLSPDGKVTSHDTFFYDANHYLVKHIHYSGNKIAFESTYTNDAQGN